MFWQVHDFVLTLYKLAMPAAGLNGHAGDHLAIA